MAPDRITIGKTPDYCSQSCLIFPENLQNKSGSPLRTYPGRSQAWFFCYNNKKKHLDTKGTSSGVFLQHPPQQRLLIALKFLLFSQQAASPEPRIKVLSPSVPPQVSVLPSCLNSDRFCAQFCITSKFNILTLCVIQGVFFLLSQENMSIHQPLSFLLVYFNTE